MAESRPSLLSRSQRSIAAFALTAVSLAGLAALAIGTVFIIGRLIGFYSGVLWPLAAAGVLALILRPLVGKLEHALRLPRMAAVIVLYVAFVGAVTAAGFLTIPQLADQVGNLAESLPAIAANGRAYFSRHYPAWSDFAQRVLEHPYAKSVFTAVQAKFNTFASETVPKFLAAAAGLTVIFSWLVQLAIIPVYLFFLLLFRGEPASNLHRKLSLLPENAREDIVFLFREFTQIIESFFRGQLIIGLIMGAIYATGFSLIGLKFGLAIGLTLGVLNIIPYLGTIIGLLITIPLAFFQPDGGAGLAGLVILVKAVAQALESWVLTPRIMGHQTGLHPFAIVVAIFFWGETLDGVLGMLLAIPLTAFFVTWWRLIRRKYLTQPRG